MMFDGWARDDPRSVPGATRTESAAGVAWEIVHARRWVCLALSGAWCWRAMVIDLLLPDADRIVLITPHWHASAAEAMGVATGFAHERSGIA